MKNKQRIEPRDNKWDIVVKMCERNSGAMNVLNQLLFSNMPIDGLSLISTLDSLGIYGTDIYVLYNDICNSDIDKTVMVIRAVQLNLFDGNILKDAAHRQDYSGRDLVPVDELCNKVTHEENQLKLELYFGFNIN